MNDDDMDDGYSADDDGDEDGGVSGQVSRAFDQAQSAPPLGAVAECSTGSKRKRGASWKKEPPKKKQKTPVQMLAERYKDHLRKQPVAQAGYQIGAPAAVVARPARSYVDDRESQIMRQMSTRLFFQAQKDAKANNKASPVEVEMMSTGGHVIIATNRNATAESIHATLSQADTKEEALTTTSFGGKKSATGKISGRHGDKLAARVYGSTAEQDAWVKEGQGTDEASRQKAIDIARKVKEGPVEKLSLSGLTPAQAKAKMDAKPGKVYVLVDGENDRHAEEKLMDVLEQSGHTDRAVVAGKMRPCVTCTGRMAHTASQGHDVVYNPRPGYVWLGQMVKQPAPVQGSTGTVIQTKTTHETSPFGTGYGSPSDTE